MERHRVEEKHFTRDRKLSFPRIILMQMNMIKRSLQKELVHFFELIKSPETITKSAFSQRRIKFKPEAFVELNDDAVQSFYSDGDYKKWKGHRLIAVDGSNINLPCSRVIKEYFGGVSNHTESIYPMASISTCYDILNEIIIEPIIEPYGTSEYSHALQHMKKFRAKDIIILDRGYGAMWLFFLLKTSGIDYIVRISRRLFPEFWDMPHTSKVINVSSCPGKSSERLKELGIEFEPFTIRLVKVKLENGETEVLATSLMNKQKFSNTELKKLYALRWGVEINYNHLKNHIEVENFSGKSVFAIKQDFYANALIENLRSVIALEAQTGIDVSKDNAKYNYKVNKNLSLGFLKDELVKLFLSDDPMYIEKIISLFMYEPVPIREGRHIKRKFTNLTKRRYRMNYRRAI